MAASSEFPPERAGLGKNLDIRNLHCSTTKCTGQAGCGNFDGRLLGPEVTEIGTDCNYSEYISDCIRIIRFVLRGLGSYNILLQGHGSSILFSMCYKDIRNLWS